MSECKDCKYNKNINCLVCIKDKVYYVGINFGKGDDKVMREIRVSKRDGESTTTTPLVVANEVEVPRH